MPSIIIATKNPYKQKKLIEVIQDYFTPLLLDETIPEPEENGKNFLEIAENKAIYYSLATKSIAISSDAGAVIPSVPEWDPLHTKRFADTDEQRIDKLLALMEGNTDRTIRWFEAMAIAKDGKVQFSALVEARRGKIATNFDKSRYQDGMWMSSITEFPQFANKNFFELTPEERAKTENSWAQLKVKFAKFMAKSDLK
jgi:inosine/xanthosine triphosphate pyrophosphatase family protein